MRTQDLGGTLWDAVVVGAGPAGGVAAAMLAARGWKVLLLEKSAWPRTKVCGGCLNSVAVETLGELGLGGAIDGAVPLDRAIWHVKGRSVEIQTPRGAAIDRSELDEAIVAHAEARGCTFVPNTAATLLPDGGDGSHRDVKIQCDNSTELIRARLVLACDGIGGTSLANESWAKWHIKRGGWMGVSTTGENWPAPLRRGAIDMHVGEGGYVGLTTLRDGRVHLAAALNAGTCREVGGPAMLIARILQSCEQETSRELGTAKFRGSGVLTRKRDCLGGHRVLAVGDACGYIEPFTGEGMGWAITAAREAVNLLPESAEEWRADLPQQWRRRHYEVIGQRQRWCSGLMPMVHHPRLAAAAIMAGNALPILGEVLAGWVGRHRGGDMQGSVG